MRNKYWVLYVSVAFSQDYDAFTLCKTLTDAVEGCDGSGAGFGWRDLEWTCDTAKEVSAKSEKVHEFFKKIEFTGEYKIMSEYYNFDEN